MTYNINFREIASLSGRSGDQAKFRETHGKSGKVDRSDRLHDVPLRFSRTAHGYHWEVGIPTSSASPR